MFGKKTVFIIGAGAGFDYNMPLGKDLKEKIANKLSAGDEHFWHACNGIFDLSRQDGSENLRRVRTFIAMNMPRAESIDNFLHTHSADAAVVALGKLAIAACILDAEQNSGLLPPKMDGYHLSLAPSKETWLSRFATMALTGILAEEAASAFENVTIVTFNYDRCIEYYLVGHLSAYLNIHERAAQEIVDSINIIHVYGKVGKLPWQSGSAQEITFGRQPSSDLLNTVSREIRTFTERLEEDDTQRRIETALCEADLIVTSGFSFGTSNWEFLQNNTGGEPKTVIAGVMGISAPNQGKIRERLINELHPMNTVDVHLCEKGTLDLLYDYSTFFD